MKSSGIKARRMAVSAVFVALMVILLYLSSLFPVMSLSIIAVAGVLPAMLVAEFGLSSAVVAYVAASALALILVPDRGNALLFVLMFGHYPIIKNLTERVKHKWFTWVIKLVAANSLFLITWFLLKSFFFTDEATLGSLIWLLWGGFNIVFVMYDICLEKLVLFYKIRFAKWMR